MEYTPWRNGWIYIYIYIRLGLYSICLITPWSNVGLGYTPWSILHGEMEGYIYIYISQALAILHMFKKLTMDVFGLENNIKNIKIKLK